MGTTTANDVNKPLLLKKSRFDISRLLVAGIAQASPAALGGRGGRSAASLDQSRHFAALTRANRGTTKDDTRVVSRPTIASVVDDLVLRLDNVTVDLPIYSPRGRSLQLAVLNLAVGGKLSEKVGRTVHVRALDQVSFDVHRGDRIGLLGHNGSGKSTLLKVVSSIYLPTSGEIHSSVNVVPLLDFNLGVDDDMTGVEAIRVGCMLRGVSKDQIAAAMADICEFTELGEFLNLPIRTYSAGMRARLAFGTATAVRPEAIAIDENLATGDAQFIRKGATTGGRIHWRGVALVSGQPSGRNPAVVLQQGNCAADRAYRVLRSDRRRDSVLQRRLIPKRGRAGRCPRGHGGRLSRRIACAQGRRTW